MKKFVKRTKIIVFFRCCVSWDLVYFRSFRVVFQEFQGCVSRDSGLWLKRFSVVFQEFQGCVSKDSGLCFKRFSVVFQEIQCCVSRDSGLCFKSFRVCIKSFRVCSKSFNVVYLFLWFRICLDWLQKRIFVCQKMLTESNDNSGPLSYGSWTHLLAGRLSNLCSKCQMAIFWKNLQHLAYSSSVFVSKLNMETKSLKGTQDCKLNFKYPGRTWFRTLLLKPLKLIHNVVILSFF